MPYDQLEWWQKADALVQLFLPIRIFQYVTVRAFCGAGTAFLLCVIFGPRVIRWLKSLQFRQYIRKEEAPPLGVLHSHKEGTPTMGGILIVGAVAVSVLLWAAAFNRYVVLALATLCYMAAVGFWDDFLKVSRKQSKGLGARQKLALQLLWALVLTVIMFSHEEMRANVLKLMVPFVKNPVVQDMTWIGAFLFIALIVIGASNAVNLTDGLDGLAVGCTGSVALSFLIMSYVAGHYKLAEYLLVPFVKGSSELAVFCGCLMGACLGFLWYNCHPAQVFMGDTGSLALGGGIAAVAILIKQELVLVIVGGVFVIEALSVIIQVVSFKLRKKRVFAMAPLHHHFELRNWSETQVTIRFWIISIICALLGVLTLKIR